MPHRNAGSSLGESWHCIRAVLVLDFTGPTLARCCCTVARLHNTGTSQVPHWYHIGVVLALRWHSIAIVYCCYLCYTGKALILHW